MRFALERLQNYINHTKFHSFIFSNSDIGIMPLSSSQQTVAKNYMKIHINPICSCCEESKFEVIDILEGIIYSNGNSSTEGASLLILATACDSCGEMKFYPAKKVGLI